MRKKAGWIWWLVAVVGLIALLARRAVGSSSAAPKVAAGYPTSDRLSPHFTWGELWGPAESIASRKRWDGPGIPSYDARIMAQVAAWLELIRAGAGGFPLVAATVGYDLAMIGPARVAIVLYPPSGSSVKRADLLDVARSTIPASYLFAGDAGVDAIMPLDYMPPSSTVTRRGVFITFNKQALMRDVGPT